jgi:hypothetical protein
MSATTQDRPTCDCGSPGEWHGPRDGRREFACAPCYAKSPTRETEDNGPLTYKLNNGIYVLAKLYKGEPYPVTYANRTQAHRKAAELGEPWDVFQFSGRPFYVAKRGQTTKAGYQIGGQAENNVLTTAPPPAKVSA